MTITRTMYKDVSAISMETKTLHVVLLHEQGGKIASFYHLSTKREFMVQAPGSLYKTLSYSGSYIEAECSGFDDCFPTVDPFYYNAEPWHSIPVPDHGEVCRLAWNCEESTDCLKLSVHGIRFPYLLEKQISFASENSLQIDYKLTNLSDYDLISSWTAHPMIQLVEGGRIILDGEDYSNVHCMFSEDKGLSSYGMKVGWPQTKREDNGCMQRLDETSSTKPQANNLKLFFKASREKHVVEYRFPEGDGLYFCSEGVPYLGLWINEGKVLGYKNIAPEFSFAPYDQPDLAEKFGYMSRLFAGEERFWSIKMVCDSEL